MKKRPKFDERQFNEKHEQRTNIKDEILILPKRELLTKLFVLNTNWRDFGHI